MLQQPKLRARYQVVGPKEVRRRVNKAFMDKETKSLQQKEEVVVEKRWMVYFPQGHSISLDLNGLKEHGFDKKPRLVDMNTGDVVDVGGDPYDFSQEIVRQDVHIVDDSQDFSLDELVEENSAQKVAKGSK
jgi:hypothetical protein